MERVRVTICKKGDYTLDLIEGYAGMSCVQKADQMAIICGGIEKASGEKPEYYDSEELHNDIFGGGNY